MAFRTLSFPAQAGNKTPKITKVHKAKIAFFKSVKVTHPENNSLNLFNLFIFSYIVLEKFGCHPDVFFGDLTFEFTGNVGITNITIKDVNNNIVERLNVDTANTLIETIDTSDWLSGTYYISVQIGFKTYIGEFTI